MWEEKESAREGEQRRVADTAQKAGGRGHNVQLPQTAHARSTQARSLPHEITHGRPGGSAAARRQGNGPIR